MKKLSVIVVTAALSGLSGINSVQAFNPQPDPPAHFGMLGIVSGQTARLNVVAQPIPVGDVSPRGPCRVALSFLNSEGNPLTERIVRVLKPGQATFLDLVGFEDPDLRKEIHPQVQVLPNLSTVPSTVPACRGVVGTVEVFDVTGVTSVLYEDPDLFLP